MVYGVVLLYQLLAPSVAVLAFPVVEYLLMVSGTAQFFLSTNALLILSVSMLYFVHLLLLMCSVIQRSSSWLVNGVALLHLLVDGV